MSRPGFAQAVGEQIDRAIEMVKNGHGRVHVPILTDDIGVVIASVGLTPREPAPTVERMDTDRIADAIEELVDLLRPKDVTPASLHEELADVQDRLVEAERRAAGWAERANELFRLLRELTTAVSEHELNGMRLKNPILGYDERRDLRSAFVQSQMRLDRALGAARSAL